jgi:hypothetical protein
MATNQSTGKCVVVSVFPMVPPPCGTNHRASIGDSATDNDVSSVLERFHDASSAEVCVCCDHSVLWFQEISSILRQHHGLVIRVQMQRQFTVLLKPVLDTCEQVVSGHPSYGEIDDSLLFELSSWVSEREAWKQIVQFDKVRTTSTTFFANASGSSAPPFRMTLMPLSARTVALCVMPSRAVLEYPTCLPAAYASAASHQCTVIRIFQWSLRIHTVGCQIDLCQVIACNEVDGALSRLS